MRRVSASNGIASNGFDGKPIPPIESPYRGWVVAARAFWPSKTAAHWASHAHVTERMARFWLAGRYEPSASGFRAILDKLYEGSDERRT